MDYNNVVLAHNTTKDNKFHILGSGFHLKKFGSTSKDWGMDFKKDLYGISFSVAKEPYKEEEMTWKGQGNTATVYAEFNDRSNPMELGFYEGEDFWKDYLHKKYNTTNGRILAKKIMKDGYTSVVTVDTDGNPMEVVVLDLSTINLFDKFPENESVTFNLIKGTKDILERKQRGILYHFTTVSNMVDILEGNFIRPTRYAGGNISNGYVSLTRNKNFDSPALDTDVALALDGDSLSDSYKIEPFNYFHHAKIPGKLFNKPSSREQEERVEGEITPVDKYIRGIVINTNNISSSEIEKIKSYGYPIEFGNRATSIQKYFYMESLEEKEINEISWTDLYPKDFIRFRKEYLKQKSNTRLYVNFSNFNDNTLDKKPYENPNHADPVGIYGYPLKYVLDYPADIWYGRNAKYLRIIENKAKHPLYVTEMTDREIEITLHNMGFHGGDISDLLKKAKRYFGYTGAASMRKAFMSVVQIKNVSELSGKRPFWSSDEKVKIEMRSGKEQTDLFLKAGIDCIIDNAKNQNSAIINPREPQQTIFLTRDSFKITDVFELRAGKEDYMAGNMSSNDEDRLTRKLASMILTKLDDSLATREAVTTNQGGFRVYWTKKGRRIAINFVTISNDNKKWGEKIHKENKFSDNHRPKITIYGEKKFETTTYDEDATFEFIANDIEAQWRANPDNPDFEPENEQTYADKESIARSKSKIDRITQEFESQMTAIQELATHYGFAFTPTNDQGVVFLLWLLFIKIHFDVEKVSYTNQLFTQTLEGIRTGDKSHYDKYLQKTVSFEEPQIEQFRKLLEKIFNDKTPVSDGYKEMTLGDYFKTRVLEMGDKQVPLFSIVNKLIKETESKNNALR